MDRMGLNGVSKVSFNVFILCGYIEHAYIYLYIYIYILENFHQHSYGFQNFMPSRVGDTIFETTLCTLVFRYFDQQVVFFVFVLNRIYPFYFNSKTLFAFKNEPLSSLLKHRYIGYFWKSYLHSPT